MVYDSMGRMVQNYEPNTHVPNHASWQYAYDDAGNLVGTADARGCGKNISYDQADRILAEDFIPCTLVQTAWAPYTTPSLADGTGTEAYYRYDTPEPGQATTPVQIAAAWGRVVSISDRGAQTRVLYDGRGRTTTVQRRLAKPGAPDASLTTRYAQSWFSRDASYDVANRLETQSTGATVLVDPDGSGSDVTMHYSARGLLASVESSYGDLLPYGNLIQAATYDADGAPLTVRYGDAAQTTASYAYQSNNGLRQLSEYKIARGKGDGPWSSSTGTYSSPSHADGTIEDVLVDDIFTYDLVGNPTDIQDGRRLSADVADWPAGVKPVDRHIDYDDNYRVTKVTYAHGGDSANPPMQRVKGAVPAIAPSSRTQWQSYSYDWLGNILNSSDDKGAFYDRSSGAHVMATNAPNRLAKAVAGNSSITPSYDVGGNIVSLVVQRIEDGCPSAAGCTHRFDYDWDEIGRLARARRWDYVGIYPSGSSSSPPYPQAPTATPAVDLHFAYDSANNRVLKRIETDTRPAYNAEIFSSLRLNHATWQGTEYQHDEHTEAPYLVVAGVALARIAYAEQDWPTLSSGKLHVFLELGDHLGSTAVVVDAATGELVERGT